MQSHFSIDSFIENFDQDPDYIKSKLEFESQIGSVLYRANVIMTFIYYYLILRFG